MPYKKSPHDVVNGFFSTKKSPLAGNELSWGLMQTSSGSMTTQNDLVYVDWAFVVSLRRHLVSG